MSDPTPRRCRVPASAVEASSPRVGGLHKLECGGSISLADWLKREAELALVNGHEGKSNKADRFARHHHGLRFIFLRGDGPEVELAHAMPAFGDAYQERRRKATRAAEERAANELRDQERSERAAPAAAEEAASS